MLWSIVVWIVIGGLAGWAASSAVKSEGDKGVLGNIILGVLGALIGGFAIELLGGEGFTGFNLWSFFVAFVGAVVLILIKRAVTK